MPESPKARQKRLARLRKYYRTHKAKFKKYAQKWRKNNPGGMAKIAKDWREQEKVYVKTFSKEIRQGLRGRFTSSDGPNWRQRNREQYLKTKRENTNRRRREIFLEALRHYSNGKPKCYCCGEKIILLLGLDHIDGGGNKQRKDTGVRTSEWAKRHGWPAIFRVACHSCNLGAHLNGGVCPHQDLS